MGKVLKFLFSDMDSYKAVILIEAVLVIGLGVFLFKQWQAKEAKVDLIEEDRMLVDAQMMNEHRQMRETISKVLGDEFAGKASGDLDFYVRSQVQKVSTLPQMSSENSRSDVKWGKQYVANEIDYAIAPNIVKTRGVSGSHKPEIKGGFSLREIEQLLFRLEKESASVRVKNLVLRPFDTDSNSRTGKLEESKPNENWRWLIEKLTVMSLTSPTTSG